MTIASRIARGGAATALALATAALPAGPLLGGSVRAEGECKPILRLDAPARDGTVRGAVTIRGWAGDVAAPADRGAGITAVDVALDATAESAGTPLGRAQFGAERPDVAGLLGEQFRPSGFSLAWNGAAAPGPHTITVTAQTACGVESLTIPVKVEAPEPNAPATPAAAAPAPAPAAPACGAILSIDTPATGAVIAPTGNFALAGWALDPAATGATAGVTDINVYAGQDAASGTMLATAQPTISRSDVQTNLGLTDARFTQSGFSVQVPAGMLATSASNNKATVTVVAQSACGPVSQQVTLDLTGAAPAASAPAAPAANSASAGMFGVTTPATSSAPAPSTSPDPGTGSAFFGLPGGTGMAAAPSTGGSAPVPSQNPNPVSTSPTGPTGTLTTGGVTYGVPINQQTATGAYGQPGTYPGQVTGTYPGQVTGTYPGQVTGTYPGQTGAYGTAANMTPPTLTTAQQVQSGYGAARAVQVAFGGVGGATAYTLYRSTSPNSGWAEVGSSTAGATSIVDQSVPAPGTYYYTVVARSSNGGYSQGSNVLSVAVR